MVAPIITGISKTAEALLKTPAGQRAIKRGTKSVNRFLKKNADDIKPPTPKQQEAGKRLQKSMKKRALNKKVQVGAGSGATGVAVGRETKSNNRKGRTDFRDMKANALKESRRKREDAFKEGRVRKTRKEAATLLNKGGRVESNIEGKRTASNIQKSLKASGLDRAKQITKKASTKPYSSLSVAGRERMEKMLKAKKKAGKKTSNMQAGGLVKKKGIDGIAKRGKTRAARSR